MKKIVLALIFILNCLSQLEAFELLSGDVLLISFNCYECRVIESETNSKFSHSGVIIKNENNEIRVGQSLGYVALYSLDQFLKNKTPGTNVSVYRPKNLDYNLIDKRMLSVFNLNFKGAPFDELYLWNNFDVHGRELFYCSEFIAKFLDHFLDTDTIPYPLSYKKNETYWKKYFHGLIPEGELGNSPASFSNDDRFSLIGTL